MADLCDPATGACSNPPIQCDDGDPCTLDACVGGTCVYSPLAGSCDDSNSCTAGDVCVAGPAGLPVCAGTAVTWSASPGASYYSTCRGTVPANGPGSRFPLASPCDQTCLESGDANGDGTLVTTDASVPPPGTAFYYLTTEEAACGQSPNGGGFQRHRDPELRALPRTLTRSPGSLRSISPALRIFCNPARRTYNRGLSPVAQRAGARHPCSPSRRRFRCPST